MSEKKMSNDSWVAEVDYYLDLCAYYGLDQMTLVYDQMLIYNRKEDTSESRRWVANRYRLCNPRVKTCGKHWREEYDKKRAVVLQNPKAFAVDLKMTAGAGLKYLFLKALMITLEKLDDSNLTVASLLQIARSFMDIAKDLETIGDKVGGSDGSAEGGSDGSGDGLNERQSELLGDFEQFLREKAGLS